jgi:dipeptidyl aminopeptidase/acylaminoacyl peptidase
MMWCHPRHLLSGIVNRMRLLSLAVMVLAGVAAQGAKLAPERYLDMTEVGDAQISPDGKRVVYTRRTIDKITDWREAALWLVHTDGRGDRQLGKGRDVTWAPDSRRIAYIAPIDGDSEAIFVRNLDDSTPPLQVTRGSHSPGNIAWSPDGVTLAFTMLVPRISQDWQVRLPGRPAGARWADEPRIIERLVFRRDGSGFLEDGFVHVFAVSATGGESRQLTQGDRSFGAGPDFVGNLSWTPDGRELLFSSLNLDDWEYPWLSSDVYAVDVATRVMRQLTRREGPDFHPLVSPDGRWVAYSGHDLANDTYLDSKLYVAGIDGSNPRDVTATLDRSLYLHPYASSPRSYWWAADSSGLYFNIGEHGRMNVYFADRSGAIRRVTQGDHVLSITDINARGEAVGTLSTYHKPYDVVTLEVAAPKPRRLTKLNDEVLRQVRLGEVEEIWYASSDGVKVQGWIVKPPDFDPRRKHPLILNIHGGPHAMYRMYFDFPMQEHAAAGYVVLYTNPRGSTGYGQAFANAINVAIGKDYEDLMRGVDEVVARGYVDQRNMFVYGCSGGGELTAWVVGHTDRFAAASANCAVTNQISFVSSTDGASFYREYAKMFWEDPTEYLQRSPIMYVDKVSTPTMLMTGERDLNTPIAQAEEFYRALKLRGVPTALVRFPDEYHGLYGVRPSNFLRSQLYMRRWFERYKR